MPDPVMFIRGFPTVLEQPSASESMMGDLKVIADLSHEQIERLRNHLIEADQFLDPKTLLATISEALQDTKSAEAVSTAIRFLTPPTTARVLADLEQNLGKKGFPFDQAKLDRLKQILCELIQPYPALVRFQKAGRLAKATGQQLEAVELICDLRPIFDENREQIEGMMPYTRLRVVATGEDGLPKPFEVELTHQDVIDLAEKAEKAKSKLKVLRQSIETWLPGGMPDIQLTRTPQRESSDA